MLYCLLYEQLYPAISGFRVFRYLTLRTAFASLTSLFLCIALGPWLIAKLREFQIGQHIREDGPKPSEKGRHAHHGRRPDRHHIIVPTLLWADLRHVYVWIALFALLCFAVIGFIDDYAKVMNRRNLGLTGGRKFALQVLVAVIYGHAGGHAVLRRLHDHAECAVLQKLSARSADPFADGKSVHLRVRLHFLFPVYRPRGGGRIQCGEYDRWPGWSRHRPDGDCGGRADHARVHERQSRAGQLSAAGAQSAHGGVDDFLRLHDGREPRLPLVELRIRPIFSWAMSARFRWAARWAWSRC